MQQAFAKLIGAFGDPGDKLVSEPSLWPRMDLGDLRSF
jgi:hypothetical protein